MIIIDIKGGLGNQLFQYALGRNLSLLNKQELKFDISHFNKKACARKYSLNNFNIAGKIATKAEIAKYTNTPVIIRYVHKLLPYYRRPLINQKGTVFDPNILLAKDAYLSGYWQSEKYFISNATTIKKDLLLKKNKLSELRSNQYFKKITDSNAVSVHIRRGDYVTNPKTNKKFGILPMEYYKKASQHIESKVKTPLHYFVFSDDITWAKKNISFENNPITFVEQETNKDYIDLMLISLCKHNITANSTFSWWGAWLNSNPDKITIAPKQWVVHGNKDVSDLIPRDWIKVRY